MAKAKARARTKAKPAAPVASGKAAASGEHYEGKQHYPKALYGKRADGVIVSIKVENADEHAQALKDSPELKFAESPADHGVETHPAAVPVDPQPIS